MICVMVMMKKLYRNGLQTLGKIQIFFSSTLLYFSPKYIAKFAR